MFEVMSTIKINSKHFEVYLTAAQIEERIKSLAQQLNKELTTENPLFVVVLNGAYIFAADLLRKITIPHEVAFVKISSYDGTKSTGMVKNVIGITQNLQNRHVVIVEDIVDTGQSLTYLNQYLKEGNPLKISTLTLLFKPKALLHKVTPTWVGFEIEPHFVIGYGLDYNEAGRNLPDIYVESEKIK